MDARAIALLFRRPAFAHGDGAFWATAAFAGLLLVCTSATLLRSRESRVKFVPTKSEHVV